MVLLRNYILSDEGLMFGSSELRDGIALTVLHYNPISSIVYCPPTGQGVQPAWITIQTGTPKTYTMKWITIPQRHTGGKTSVPTTTQTVTHQSGNSPGVCNDKIQNCIDYGDVNYACQGSFASWAKLNCARYCGFCCVPTTFTTATTTKTTPLRIPTRRTTPLRIPTIRTTKHQTTTMRTTTPPIPTVRHTTPKAMTTRTISTCRDHRDCSLEVVDRLACHDVSIATKCQKSCGICHESHTSNHCQDARTNCQLISSFVCTEPILRQECRKTCHLC